MTNNKFFPKGFFPWRLSWLTIVLGLLTIITFIAVSNNDGRYITPMMRGGVGMMEYAVDSSEAMSPTTISDRSMPGYYGMTYPYPYPNPDVPVTDTREFLKIYYSASMYTRDVATLTRRVETTVRGHAGRVDQQSSSPRYGFVSFAIPQNQYEAFRVELESLVANRFLTVNISSQNLLPQKVSIEEQQKQADAAITDSKLARQKIVNTYTSTIASLQAQIDAITTQLEILRNQESTPQILLQIQNLSDNWTALKQQLARENARYTEALNNADANIKYAEEWQKAVQTQDQTFLENIATVTGTVSIQWISFWGTVQLYLPGYWTPTIFALLTLFSFLRDRRRFDTI